MSRRAASLFTLASALVAAASTLACSQDVYLTPTSVHEEQQAIACHVEAHENVCDRPLDVAPDQRDAAIRFLQGLAELSGDADDALGTLEEACTNILTMFGSAPEDAADVRVNVIVRCPRAAQALRQMGPFDLVVGRSSCSSAELPTCLRGPDGAPLIRCRCAVPIELRMKGSTERDAVLEAALAPIFALKSDLETIADVVPALDAPAALPDSCAGDASAMATQVTADVQAVMSATTAIFAAVGP